MLRPSWSNFVLKEAFHAALVLLGSTFLVTPLAVYAEGAGFFGTFWTDPPAANEFDTEDRRRIRNRAEQFESMTSLLVARDGTLVIEQYSNGLSRDDAVNIKSASKSVLSALVGIALEQGYLRSLDQSLDEFFPELLEDASEGKKKITLKNLLLMRSGLESTSFENYGGWVTSDDWLRNALQRPLVDPPGEVTNYSTGNSHILSAVLTEVTGRDLRDYTRENLFDPLDIEIRA